ncbi:hypothetical protein BASA81_003784 [Batrachochytrium salamandrivorans]|nr:hypothetical protein BASA81_003784 [Batrachochytrium salamandrivorans]
MIVTKEIVPGEVLLRFPLGTYISPLNLRGTDMEPIVAELDKFYGLVLVLLYELSLGAKSQFAQHLALLDKELVPLPRFWTAAEQTELQDDVLIAHYRDQRKDLDYKYFETRAVLKKYKRYDLLQTLTPELYEWAVCIVKTRSHEGVNDTNSMLPVADLMNHHTTHYIGWSMNGPEYVFAALTHQAGFAPGSQIYQNYGGGEDNRHTLGEYGYVPFPNLLNSEFLYMDEVSDSEWLDDKIEATEWENGELSLDYVVSGTDVQRFFRIAVATPRADDSELDLRFDWEQERQAMALCVGVMRDKLERRRTTIGEDYLLLHNPPSSLGHTTRMKLALMYRIDAKVVLHRHLHFCQRIYGKVLPCLAHKRSLVAQWRYFSALRFQEK